MNVIKSFTLSLSLAVVLTQGLHAQQNSTTQLSLKQAQDYALKNSQIIKNVKIDLESAKQKIWETTAIGLPQINGKVAGSYMLQIPAKVEEFASLGSLETWMYNADQALKGLAPANQNFGYIPNPGTPATVTDNQMKWGLTLDITVSQLLFSGTYIIGIQAFKAFKQFSEVNITKSENDLLESVSNAYFLCVIAQENKMVIDSIYQTTGNILKEITEIQKEGIMEETDVDQMQLTLTNIQNTKEMIDRQCEVALNLLKFQMGMDLKEQILLKDKTDDLIGQLKVDVLIQQTLNVENQIDYRLLTLEEKRASLNVKYQKSFFLPEVAAFYDHQENFNPNSFTFSPPNVLGLSVNIPIFGSGQKLSRVSQANLDLEKIKNGKTQLSIGLQTQFSDARSSFITSMNKYQANKQARDLAYKIYTRSLVKYKEGLMTSLELAQAQSQYLQAQTNYYSSIIDMSSSYSKLEKLLK